MSRTPRRITLRIDRISADIPGIDRAALETALRQEIARALAGRGGEAPMASRSVGLVRAELPAGRGASIERIARAVIKGTTR